MSWLAVKYALACRDKRVKGSVRLVLVALGARVEYRRITTPPTSLGDLQWITFLSHEQLRRILDDLEEIGEVRRLSRGKNAVYGLPKMAGPLFVWTDTEPVKMTDFVLDELPKKTRQDARKVTGRMPGFSSRRAGGLLFSEVLSTKVLTTAAEDACRAAEALVTWARTEYPRHRNGAVLSLKSDDVAIALELLASRPADRLQKMLIVEWTVTPAEDLWLSQRTDRGFRLLRHAATRLDAILAERERLEAPRVPPSGSIWETCPHTPTCLSQTGCRKLAGSQEATG